MAKLVHVIHVSSATAPGISEYETFTFLKQARTANRKYDISGMMLYIGGCFLQLLEGEETNVDAVCRTIFHDKRAMKIIRRAPIVEREFPDWTMGFAALTPLEAGTLLGDPCLFDAPCPPRIESEGARTLLSIIGRRLWQSDRSGMFRAIRLAG